ncbi:MAG: NAD-dependent epimerase/dehydratase family protein, partial [Elusimicrobiota bacterium]
MNEKILVVGGAGYIGSHCVLQLSKEGFFPVVVDNLSRGHADAVLAGEFIKADLGHTDELRAVFKKHDIKGVMHFAAFAYVGESMEQPDKYYINNVSNMINLLNVMKEFDIKN